MNWNRSITHIESTLSEIKRRKASLTDAETSLERVLGILKMDQVIKLLDKPPLPTKMKKSRSRPWVDNGNGRVDVTVTNMVLSILANNDPKWMDVKSIRTQGRKFHYYVRKNEPIRKILFHLGKEGFVEEKRVGNKVRLYLITAKGKRQPGSAIAYS